MTHWQVVERELDSRCSAASRSSLEGGAGGIAAGACWRADQHRRRQQPHRCRACRLAHESMARSMAFCRSRTCPASRLGQARPPRRSRAGARHARHVGRARDEELEQEEGCRLALAQEAAGREAKQREPVVRSSRKSFPRPSWPGRGWSPRRCERRPPGYVAADADRCGAPASARRQAWPGFERQLADIARNRGRRGPARSAAPPLIAPVRRHPRGEQPLSPGWWAGGAGWPEGARGGTAAGTGARQLLAVPLSTVMSTGRAGRPTSATARRHGRRALPMRSCALGSARRRPARVVGAGMGARSSRRSEGEGGVDGHAQGPRARRGLDVGVVVAVRISTVGQDAEAAAPLGEEGDGSAACKARGDQKALRAGTRRAWPG